MQTMYPPQNNGPHTLLTVAINDAVTDITVEDASVLPDAPNVLTIGLGEDAELVLVQAKTGNILTAQRGFNGTAAKSWNAGDWIYRGVTAQDVSALQANIGELAAGQAAAGGVISGRNILHNWDLSNPVNQRGQAYYLSTSDVIPSIDRWNIGNGELVLSDAGYTSIYANQPSGILFVYQIIEPKTASMLAGKTATLSWMLSNGTVTKATGTFPAIGDAGLVTPTVGGCTMLVHNVSANNCQVQMNFSAGASAWMRAVKLELGSVSTLANDPPMDHARELLVCQRYFEKSSPIDGSDIKNANTAYMAASVSGFTDTQRIAYKVEKRINPTITLYPNYNAVNGSTRWSAYYTSNVEVASSQIVRNDTKGFQVRIQPPSGQTWPLGASLLAYGNWTASADL